MNFVELCIKGDILSEEIDEYVLEWHEGRAGENQELHEFLGLSWDEYSLWSTTPSMLEFILSARKRGTSFEEELSRDRYALAARANSTAEAKRIMEWLQHEES